jgi:hypothetical protein
MVEGRYWMSHEKWTQRIDCVNMNILDDDYAPIIAWNIMRGNKDANMRKRHWAAIRVLLRDVEGAISHCNHNVRDKQGKFTKVKQ